MKEIISMLYGLAHEVKYLKTMLSDVKKTRLEQLAEEWIDGQEVMHMLNISKRTLQTLRDTNVLPYSKISGKFYYKIGDIEALLQTHYVPVKTRG